MHSCKVLLDDRGGGLTTNFSYNLLAGRGQSGAMAQASQGVYVDASMSTSCIVVNDPSPVVLCTVDAIRHGQDRTCTVLLLTIL